jgi:hypothetical protein
MNIKPTTQAKSDRDFMPACVTIKLRLIRRLKVKWVGLGADRQ